MKIGLGIIVCLLTGHSLFAQINRVEYFIDTDPGFGSATSVNITPATTLTNLEFNVPLTSIQPGFHSLFIRARSAANRWSTVSQQLFYKERTTSISNLNRIEYFVDTDPGFGAATSVNFASNATVNNLEFTVPLTNVSVGFHSLLIRGRDAAGQWSTIERRLFFKDAVNQSDIVRLEYFIDTDPGFGLATMVPITQGTMINNLEYTVGLTGVSNGAHRLLIRAQNALGRWSTINVRDFTVQDNVVSLISAPAGWCRNTPFNLAYTVTGTYGGNNIFSLQLSDATGSFLSGVTTLTTLTSTTSGTLSVTIPNSVAIGSGYRLRMIPSNPSLTNMPTLEFPVTTVCTCASIASIRVGNWTDPATWTCNRQPISTDVVQLKHLVTLPTSSTGQAQRLTYYPNGLLRYDANARLQLTP